jgi:hypothetical protein
MDNLDLDINNYSIKDIEKFFRFSTKTKYNAKDIELREYQIREQLLNSGHINKRFKRDLIEFLTLAKNWLIFVKCNPAENPTTIPKNYKLDNVDTPVSKEAVPRTDELINRPDTQFVHSNNSDFFPGSMNPLSTRIITKCLNIDTRFRENLYTTQSSDFTLHLPTKFNKVVSMQLASVEIPVAFYGISSAYGNHYLYLKVHYNSFDNTGEKLTDEKVFTISDGNFTANDFIDKVNQSLVPTNIDGTLTYPNSVFSYLKFEIDVNANGSGTGKAKILPDGNYANFITEVIMDFSKDINGNPDTTDLKTKIGWNLGFYKHRYSGSTQYIADTIIEPATIRYIYLAIDDFQNSSNNHFISVFNKSILSPNILARISIKGSYFTLLMESDYSIVSEPRKYFGPVDIQKLRIRLFDEHGRILQMNNSNFSFCLNLKMLYDL